MTDVATLELAPGYELPTARQVVGRGLQLAYDATRDIRRASLYVGLVILAVAGPAVLLYLVDLSRLGDLGFFSGEPAGSPERAAEVTRLVLPLLFAGGMAFCGTVAILLDGALLTVAILAGRAVGRPLTLREALQRGRQVFWRYAFAAFVVGVLSVAISWAVGTEMGTLGSAGPFSVSLLTTLVSALVTAPFGYILAATVIGDVNGAAALGRSLVLVRARPRLAIAVAAFAFFSDAIQTFGLSAALGIAAEVGQVLHLDVDVASGGVVLLAPLIAVALVAFGSLTVTVSAIAAAPQVTAFLGLTHYAAGLDRARVASLVPAARPPDAPAPDQGADPASDPGADPPAPVMAVPEVSAWVRAAEPRAVVTRWITRPMAALAIVSALTALVAIVEGLS